MITQEQNEKRPLSYSSGKNFLISPQHYMHYLTKPFEPTPALIFGNLVDCLLLTPNEFETRYVIAPKFDRRTKQGKLDYDEFLKNNTTKAWIDQDMLDEAKLMVEAANTNPISKKLLERITQTQIRHKWVDKKTGLHCITILDGEGSNIIFDLKTCASADPEDFQRDAFNLDYPLQAGFALEYAKVKKFEFPEYYYLCLEKGAPYAVSVNRASDEYLEYGKQRYRELMDKFKYCMDKGLFQQSYEFRSMFTGEHILELPGWARKKLQE